jgi:lysophospholipid acyltransferase (LPLAT)-like uncharacterized protein
MKNRLLMALIPFLAAMVMRLLFMTIRTETIGETNLRSLWHRGERAILPFWHDQLLLMVFGYPGKYAKLLISKSNDGELLARTMRFFAQDTVRGSSSRGGRAAFREMLEICKADADIVLTPDGPKGPRHEIKDGVVQLAKLGKRAVIPMAFACSSGHRFSSWDRFLFPFPFSRGVYAFGEALYFQADETVDDFRQRVALAMADNQRMAEDYLEARGATAV